MLSRPEFDSGPAADARSAEASLSVGELNRRARLLLERGIGLVRVRGEISGFVRAASGHIYFSLKDADAQVRCVLWRTRAGALAFEPKNGDAVDVRASVTLFEARGEYQLNVESMRRAGAGALFEQFLRLKEKLAAEGLFDPVRKRDLPALPRAIGIVTSLQAAALRDVVTTLSRRAPMIPVIVYPAPVQGEGAAQALAAAIAAAGRRAAQDALDVLIVCRGGGSMEDLWSFNEEVVARAIAACPVPVVSGVGHETDFTISDWVADVRAPTPTAAAELVSPDIGMLFEQLAAGMQAATRAMADTLEAAQQRLDWLVRGLRPPSVRLAMQRQALLHGEDRLRNAMLVQRRAHRAGLVQLAGRLRAPALPPHAQALAYLAQRLATAVQRGHDERNARVERLAGEMAMLNPARVLERGYAIVRSKHGSIVRDSASLSAGDALNLQFAHGEARVKVESVREAAGLAGDVAYSPSGAPPAPASGPK